MVAKLFSNHVFCCRKVDYVTNNEQSYQQYIEIYKKNFLRAQIYVKVTLIFFNESSYVLL
jgi:hypothetical protein